MLDFLDRKTRELQAGNKVAEWAMCCVKCCVWCLEKIVAFINRCVCAVAAYVCVDLTDFAEVYQEDGVPVATGGNSLV